MEKKRKSYSPLSGINKNLPFGVPDNYFERLKDSVMDRITESEKHTKQTTTRRLVPLLSLAGAAALLAGLLFFLPGIIEQRETFTLSAEEIAYVLEDEIYDLDGQVFESSLSSSEQDESSDMENYQNRIIQYLLDENIELESIVNEL